WIRRRSEVSSFRRSGRGPWWGPYAAADNCIGREPAGVRRRDRPRSVATHRQASQVYPLRISVEFRNRLVERLQCDTLHFGFSPPAILQALRKHHDACDSAYIPANGGPDADFGLYEAVVATFSGAVE